MSIGADLIAAERTRQVTEEEYTAEHDIGHAEELARAADAYTQYAILRLKNPFLAPEQLAHPADFLAWPEGWDRDDWKPEVFSPLRNLVKAGALIAAAIDALQVEGTK